MNINQETWTLPCQSAAERDALLAHAEDYEVPVCWDRLSLLPEARSIGWCDQVGALIAFEQTGPDGLPNPGIAGFQAMCARYAAFNVLA